MLKHSVPLAQALFTIENYYKQYLFLNYFLMCHLELKLLHRTKYERFVKCLQNKSNNNNNNNF